MNTFSINLQVALMRAKMIAAKHFERAVAYLVGARVSAEAAFAYVAKLVARRAVVS